MKKAPQRAKEAKEHIDQFQSSGSGRVVNRLAEIKKSCEAKKSSDLGSMSNYFEAIVSREIPRGPDRGELQ